MEVFPKMEPDSLPQETRESPNSTALLKELGAAVIADDAGRLRKELLANPMLWQLKDEIGQNIVHWAAASDSADCLSVLAELDSYNKEWNSLDYMGRAPLHLAAYGGRMAAIEVLLRVPGVYVDEVTKNGCTPLYFAVARGNVSAVARLLQANANPNLSTSVKSTPLIAAATSGFLEIVNLLLSAGADVNFCNDGGRNAAHCAAVKGWGDLVDRLSKTPNFDAHKHDNDGCSPFDLLERRRTASVKFPPVPIFEKGKCNSNSSNSRTALCPRNNTNSNENSSNISSGSEKGTCFRNVFTVTKNNARGTISGGSTARGINSAGSAMNNSTDCSTSGGSSRGSSGTRNSAGDGTKKAPAHGGSKKSSGNAQDNSLSEEFDSTDQPTRNVIAQEW